ncbi:MAG: hypothetical protein ACE5GM_09920 [bacterium]
MELEDIHNAIKEYRELFEKLVSQKGQEEEIGREISFLVENILGYVEKKEVLRLQCGISKLVPPCSEDCDQKFKFLIEAKNPNHNLVEDDLEDGVECVLKNGTSMLVLTNGRQLKLYAVAELDGEIARELIFDFDLMNESLNLLSQNLWTLCRKDCGRKIIVHLH